MLSLNSHQNASIGLTASKKCYAPPLISEDKFQQVQSQQDSLQSQTKQALLQQLVDANKQIENLEQEQIKAQQRLALYQIKAPIDGTVQQLATNTIGGVVTPAQELMVIVPKNQKLEVEAMLLNKDIGFVHEGRESALKAEVKIDTFNFTKYGVIHAKVNTISSDAMQMQGYSLLGMMIFINYQIFL